MFDFKVTNNYFEKLTLQKDDETITIGKGKSGSSDGGGHRSLQIPHMGTALILDLGDNKLHGYSGKGTPQETWGVLIRYQGDDFYYRYEGGGKIEAEVDEHGCLLIHEVQGTALNVNLKDVRYKANEGEPEDKS